MSDVTISYKGADIATMDASGTKTLQTQGKYCEGDISIAYVKPSGGGSVAQKDVNFYDYDGSIVASYSAADFANLAQLPANPAHTGLISQGWNWTLVDAQTYVAVYGNLDVGQMYVTDDGKTRIYIRLEQGRLAPYFGIAVNGTATIDWGDGSTASIVTGDSTSTVVNTQHIYSAPGDYVIAVSINGSASLLGTTIGSQVLWKNSQVANENRCYQNSIQRVELGIGIDIGGSAFSNCYSLTSITLPSGMTSIGGNAFFNCRSLTSITLPSGVTSIGDSAFFDCYSLTSIMLPNSATSIFDHAFDNCSSLTSITLPSDVTSISNYAFYSCYSLASIMLPSGVTRINSYAFSDCRSLANITISSGVTSISDRVFYNCASVGEIHFKSSTPPTVSSSYTFTGIPTDCIIYVPIGKLTAYTSASKYPSSSTYTYREE